MAKKSRNTLKGYFETGKKPTEGQYNNLIDSHVLLSGENTGSFLLLGDTNITGDITASGGFKTTALSTFGSGSFTNVTSTGNADITGTVVADQFKGDGSQLTGVTSTVVNVSAVTASFGTGSLVVSGNLYHASASSNILLAIETTGSIVPGDNDVYDLGAPTKYFKDSFVSRSHAKEVVTDKITADLFSGGIFEGALSSSTQIASEISGSLSAAAIAALGAGIQSGSSQLPAGVISSSIAHSETVINNTLFVSGSEYYTSASAAILKGIAITGSIIPGANDAFDLGSPTKVWKDLWVSEDSIRFVSASGKVTRFKQSDVENLKAGKPIDVAVKTVSAVGDEAEVTGLTNYIRPDTIFHPTDDETALLLGTIGKLVYRTPGGDPFTIHADGSGNDFIRLGSTTTNATRVIIPGNISASKITGAHQFGGTTTFGHGTVTIDGPNGHITASGDISGGLTSNITIGETLTAKSGSFTHITRGSIKIDGDAITSPTVNATDLITSDLGTFVAITNVNTTHVTASGNISASLTSTGSFGKVVATSFHGDGTNITGVTAEWDGSHNGDAEITGSLILKDGSLTTDFANVEKLFIPGQGVGTMSVGETFSVGEALEVIGNISASKNIIGQTGSFGKLEATFISGDGSGITGVTADWDGNHNGDASITGSLTLSGSGTPSLNILGEITASGTIKAEHLHSTDDAVITDLLTVGRITSTGNSILGNAASDTHTFTGAITASGDISSSGNIITSKVGESGYHYIDFGPAAGTGGYIKLSSDDTEIMRLDGDSGRVGIGTTTPSHKLTVTGDISASGTVYADSFQSVGGDDQMSFTDNINLTGDFTSSGNISSSGTLTTKDLITDFANIEKLYLPGQGVGTMTVGSTFAVGETVQVVGNVSASRFAGIFNGALSSSAQIADEISGSLSATAIAALGAGIISGSAGLPAGVISSSAQLPSGTISSSVQLPSGIYSSSLQLFTNITASGNISASGTVYASNFESAGASAQTISFNDDLDISGKITATGNVSSSLTSTGSFGKVEATSISGDGSGITGVTAEWDGSHNGDAEITGSLIIKDGILTTDFANIEKLYLPGQGIGTMSVGETFAIGETLQVVGNVSASRFAGIFNGALSSSAQIADEISGSLSATAIAALGAGIISGSAGLPAGVISSSAQLPSGIISGSEHIFTALTSSGNISSSLTSTGSFGRVETTTLVGTLETAAQTNITSVGTLSSLTTTGNVSGSLTSTGSFGKVEATSISGDGSGITGVTAEWDGSHNGDAEITGSLTIKDGTLTTDFANIEKLYLPGQGVGTMSVGETFAVGETLQVVGNVSASRFAGIFNGALSSSAQISDEISGSLSATAIAALGASIISGAAQLPSGTISSSAQLPSGTISSSAQLPSGIYSSSLQLFTDITASGNISASGTVYASNFESAGASAQTISFNDDLDISGKITATGNVSSSITSTGSFGKVEATSISGDGSGITGVTAEWDGSHNGDAEITGSLILNSGSLTTNYISSQKLYIPGQGVGTMSVGSTFAVGEALEVVGNIAVTNISASGYISASALILDEGVVFDTNITSSGNISASGTIYADNFEAATNITASGNIEATGNISASGDLSADNLTVLTDITVVSGSVSGSLTSTGSFGKLEATSISGDGSGITGVTAEWDGSHNGDAEITGSLTIQDGIITSDFANIEKLYLPGQGVGTMAVGQTFAIGETLQVVGNISASGIVTSITGSFDKVEASVVSSSTATFTTLTNVNTTNITASGVIDTDTLTVAHITASGNVSGSLISTASFGKVEATMFSGDGSLITGVTAEWDGSHNGDATITGSLILSGSGTTGLNVEGNITSSGNISSSLTSTGSFGHIRVGGGDFTSASLAAIVDFGNVTDITASSDISSSLASTASFGRVEGTTISATYLVGDGSSITGVTAEWDGSHNGDAEITGSLVLNSGSLTTDFANIEKLYIPGQGIGTMSVGSTFAIGEVVEITGNINISGDITSSGNISSSLTSTASFGKVEATSISGDGSGLTGITAEWDGTHNGDAEVTGSFIVSGSVTVSDGSLTTGFANIEKLYIPGQGVGTMTVGSTFAVGETLEVIGNISASGTIIATTGSFGYIDLSAVSAFSPSGNISASSVTGTHVFGGSSTFANNITASGNISSSLTSTGSFGKVEATSFSGDGSGITGVTAEWDGSHNGDAEITGSLVLNSGSLTTNFANIEKLYLPGQGVGTMSVGSTFAIGETIDAVGNISASGNIIGTTGSFGRVESTMFSNILIDSSGLINFGADDIILTHSSNDLALTGGTLTVDGGVKIDNITIDGTEIDLSSGDLTIDVAGDIEINADGGDITFKDGTQTAMSINMSTVAGDAIFKDAGGTEIFRIDGSADSLLMASGKKIEFADTGEYISSDGTDLTIASGGKINLTATSDVIIPANVGITFGTGEKIEGNNTDLTITSGADINLTATADVNIPSGVGVTFGDDGEKIEGDGTDLTIASSAKINLTATSDVIIPANVGLILDGSGAEKIESDGTDITISVGSGGDINIPSDIGITFGNDGEKIEGDGTDLTIASSGILNITTTNGINTTGAITASSDISSSLTSTASLGRVEATTVSATYLTGDGSGITGVDWDGSHNGDAEVTGSFIIKDGILTTDFANIEKLYLPGQGVGTMSVGETFAVGETIEAVGNISASGNIIGTTGSFGKIETLGTGSLGRVEATTLAVSSSIGTMVIGTDFEVGKAIKIEGNVSASGYVSATELILDYDALPSSDPGIKGQVYRNGSNQLFISAG